MVEKRSEKESSTKDDLNAVSDIYSSINLESNNLESDNIQGLQKRILITYNLSNLSQTQKVKFFYALKGRNTSPGIIKRTSAVQLAKTVLLIKTEHETEFKEFFKIWKVDHSSATILADETITNLGCKKIARKNVLPDTEEQDDNLDTEKRKDDTEYIG